MLIILLIYAYLALCAFMFGTMIDDKEDLGLPWTIGITLLSPISFFFWLGATIHNRLS